MIKSMTGFGSATGEDDFAAISVTVRTVNHRHLDIQCRVPQILAEREGRLRAQIQRHVARGRVELNVTAQLRNPAVPVVELNEGFVSALASALETARARGLVVGNLAPGDLLRFPQAMTVREQPSAPGETTTGVLHDRVECALESALVELDGMRVREGEHLRADLDARQVELVSLVEGIVAAADEGRAGVEARLAKRVGELAAELPAEPAAIAQEIVRTAARSDISEEVVRFRAHLQHWATLSEAPEPCGRKLDFLLQEMNREINTIGSKAEGPRVSELVVSAKAEMEKMREQVQNVE